MNRYVLIDAHSGYVWGDCFAADPATACRIIEEGLGVNDRDYRDIGRERFDGRSGYHVHVMPERFQHNYDGQDQGIIEAVTAMPLAARVLTSDTAE